MGKSVRIVKKPDIFVSIIPIYYLSKFTGLAPFSLSYCHDKKGKVEVTVKTLIPAVLYTVLLITVVTAAQCFVLTIYRFVDLPCGTEEKNQVLVLVFALRVISCVTCLVTALTRIRKEMDSLLYKLSVIDTLLGTQNDVLRSNEKSTWIQVTLLAPILFFVYVNDSFSMNSDYKIVLWATGIFVCNFIRFVTTMQYVNLIYLLRQKFNILNNYISPPENLTEYRTNNNLWEMLLQEPRFSNEDMWKDDVQQIEAFHQALYRRHISTIMQGSTNICIQNSWLHKKKLLFRALRIIWDVLCDISSSVNSIYGLQILLCIVLAFIEMTLNLSFAIIELKLTDTDKMRLYLNVVIPVIWSVMEFLKLLWIAAACNATCGEANRSVTLLQKLLLLPEVDPGHATEIQLFLQQVKDRRPKFTAWDFFTINYSLFGSTVGALVTYLVIIVQMQAN
jgi:hypothetical protein